MQNTYKTLSDINSLMCRIGCYSKTQMDSNMHKKYLQESVEDEAYKFGHHSNGELKKNRDENADESTKIEITDSYAILWNASKSNAIQSLLDKGANIEFIGSSAGTYVWGKGIYTNFQRYQAHWRTIEDKGLYGSILVKFKYHGNLLKECLVSEPQFWDKSGTLSEQVKRFPGLEKYLRNKLGHNSLNRLDVSSNGQYSSQGMTLIREACGGWRNMAEILLGFGVQGVVFFGRNDRPVAVIYDADKLEILDYADNTKVKDLNQDLEWKGLKQDEGGRTDGNDVNPILQYFKDYKGSTAYSRPQCGELLLTDKKTGKFTFINFNRAKEIISNLGNEDPRLFGDFEFEMAQNFKETESGDLAYVQLDKDKNSQFYIDKQGYLYCTIGGRPISNIKEYYPDANEPSNNDVKDIDFDDSDIDLEDFEKIFGESIKRIIKESLQDESRTETQDGHVELDNFDLARKLMKFNGPDDAYFIQLVERHKDHPDRFYPHNACDYKSFFEVTSIEHLNAIEPVIKRLCQKGEWRAMMYINPRPMGDTRDFAHNVLEPRFKQRNSGRQGHEVEVAYGQSKDWPNRPLCFVDVDNDNPQVHQQILDYIHKMGIKPLDMYNTTNNGLHIILPDKEDARKLDFSFLDNDKKLGKWATAGLEIDKSITLYAYVKPKGYGVQNRMQQRLGGR